MNTYYRIALCGFIMLYIVRIVIHCTTCYVRVVGTCSVRVVGTCSVRVVGTCYVRVVGTCYVRVVGSALYV